LAQSDPFVKPASVTRQERQLRAADCEVEVNTYLGTGRWFFEWDRTDAYDPDAAALAWLRTVEFLDRHLPSD